MLGTDALAEISTTAVNILTVIDYVAKLTRDNIPTLQDEVVVEVVGQPGASKQELYYLAMAAANGIVARTQPLLQLNPFLPPSAASLMIEYDAADHWVRCSLTYRSAAMRTLESVAADVFPKINVTSTVSVSDIVVNAFTFVVPGGWLANIVLSLLPDKGFFPTKAVYRGPQCEVVGAPLDFSNILLPGIPNSINEGAPELPWDGKTILTNCPTVPDPRPITPITDGPVPSRPLKAPGAAIPSPNPLPTGDNRSRGSVTGINTTSPGNTASPSTSGGSASSQSSSQGGKNPKCCPQTQFLVELVSAALTDPGANANETWLVPAPGPTNMPNTPVGG